MTSHESTALVVLHPGPPGGLPPERAGEAPPDPTSAALAVQWFQDQGFATGPVVGISFAISGDDDVFSEALGAAVSALETGLEQELPLDALAEHVRPLVAAIVVTAPPEFGPGNP